MLETVRENAKSWIIQVVIGAVAVVFIFSFGPGSRRSGPTGATGWAAKVNGVPVPASSFNMAYQQRAEFQKMMRGGSYSNEDARADDLRTKVMDEVVDRELIAQAGEAQGLHVGDDEVFDQIRDARTFQGKDGKFDPAIYRKYVTNYVGLSPAKYEERVRRELLAQRAGELGLDTLTVSDDELKAEFLKGEEGASIEFVRFAPSAFKDEVTVSDADADKILATRMDDVKKAFESNKWKYEQPKAVRVRRLFEPVKQESTAADEAAAKKKVEDAKAALASGSKSWDELASTFKNAPEAEKGGVVGWVEQGRSPFGKTFEEAAFGLEKNKPSGVVRDRFGYQIIEVLEERPAATKNLDDVKKEIALDLAKESKAKELAQAAATEALAQLKAGKSLSTQFPKAAEGAPASAKPQAQTTDTFHPYGGFIPGIGAAPKVAAAAFGLTAEKKIPDAPIEDQNAFFVLELKSRTRADLAKLDAAKKDELRTRLTGQKKEEMRKAWVAALRKEAKVDTNAELLSYDLRPGYGQQQ